MPLRVPAIRFEQKSVPMYLAALPIKELEFCSIDHWDPKRTGRWKGYQRGLVQKKIRNLARYLERADAILPVAGLLNVRERRALQFSGEENHKASTGELVIPDDIRLWVVDMQHRLEGIRAAHSGGFLKNFLVPVLITEGLPAIREAAQFYIINTRSRRMGVDLTRRLLIEHREINDLTDVPEWELKAVQITIQLNLRLKDNPWYGRIREPESERSSQHIATEKSFVPSLRWLLTAPRAKHRSVAKLSKFLAHFWEGMRMAMPEPFKQPRSYLIQKNTRLYGLSPLGSNCLQENPERLSKNLRKALQAPFEFTFRRKILGAQESAGSEALRHRARCIHDTGTRPPKAPESLTQWQKNTTACSRTTAQSWLTADLK